jgi:hypothetical protein
MKMHAIALFGEAERGEFTQGLYCKSVAQLAEEFGHPPPESVALPFAIRAMMSGKDVIFFRVREEGYSTDDYITGLRLLARDQNRFKLSAIALPGVGDSEIIDYSTGICMEKKSILITTEADLYDYLTLLQSAGDHPTEI